MPNRSKDWLTQGYRDLDFARYAAKGAYHEWACFAAQQAGDKALKALITGLNGEARGHALVEMAHSLPSHASPSAELVDAARRLDRHYIPTRYPDRYDRGVPRDYFTAADSNRAIADADDILKFCARQLP